MAIFNSNVKLPEGTSMFHEVFWGELLILCSNFELNRVPEGDQMSHVQLFFEKWWAGVHL